MPLPRESLTIEGGCNCCAVRYRVEIPSFDRRPVHLAGDPEAQREEIRLPMVATDNCNDCRRATGSILPFWICAPISMVSGLYLPRSDSSSVAEEPKAGTWLPATNMFKPTATSEKTFLTFYKSSEVARRSFCGRCGTNLTYTYFGPTPDGWVETVDIVLGTVDRKYLEGRDLAPERHLWWDYGIDWIKDFTINGASQLDKHPDSDVSKVAH